MPKTKGSSSEEWNDLEDIIHQLRHIKDILRRGTVDISASAKNRGAEKHPHTANKKFNQKPHLTTIKGGRFKTLLDETPETIRQKFKFKPNLPLKVFDGTPLTGEEHQDPVWDRYGQHLTRREGKQKIRIKRGHEFKLIDKLIDDGILPFIKQPIEKEDLRDPSTSFELRDHQ